MLYNIHCKKGQDGQKDSTIYNNICDTTDLRVVVVSVRVNYDTYTHKSTPKEVW